MGFPSSLRNPGLTGCGGIIRDSDNNMVLIVVGPVEVCDSTKAKTMAFLMGLRELKYLGLIGGIVEGDSSVVITRQFGKGKQFGSLNSIVHHLFYQGFSSLFSHVSRNLNKEVGRLAKWKVGHTIMYKGVVFHSMGHP